jgi:hypothetical protein
MAGGHVVLKVLEEALEKVGFGLYAQTCSPGCKHGFAHKDVTVACEADGSDEPTVKDDVDTISTRITGIEQQPEEDILTDLELLFFNDAGHFAKYKNYARRIRDLEDLAREYVDELLSINYRKVHDSTSSFRQRVWNVWSKRKERRRSAELIAILWLLLARLETLRRDWFGYRRALADATASNALLFEIDKVDDDEAVTTQDFSFINSAIQQSANRLDTRTIALVTAAGGIMAIVGAILGALLAGGG